MYTIGIDLGTSSVKLLLVRDDGTTVRETSAEYPLYFPKTGWSEQNPADWWTAVRKCLKEITADIEPEMIRGIGTAGQMHGLVVLDENDNVIRPCILWNDGRTSAETAYLNDVTGREFLYEHTGNIAFAGFTAPKILWMKNNEPELFARIRKIMLPKDYINYMLTGVWACDYSDASGMLLLDVEHKCWSEEMIRICGISRDMLPDLYESWQKIGTVKKEIAGKLGLSADTVVCAGAGDNAAAAIGTGTVKSTDGAVHCNISLGTSGTVFVSNPKYEKSGSFGIHSFAHADGAWHLMGCMLSAASCNKWWQDEILHDTDYSRAQALISPEALGRNHVYFLPYLMGERSPINDTDARGMFVGLSMDTTREEMTLAVLEGVAFGIRDSIETAGKAGIRISRSMICGGGSKSPLWRKIFANVLGIPLDLPETEQGPGYGGAMLAMVCAGIFPDVETVCGRFVHVKDTVQPDPELTALYEERYRKFSAVYPACRELFQKLKD